MAATSLPEQDHREAEQYPTAFAWAIARLRAAHISVVIVVSLATGRVHGLVFDNSAAVRIFVRDANGDSVDDGHLPRNGKTPADLGDEGGEKLLLGGEFSDRSRT